MAERPALVVLNGASSAGKTTLARAIQRRLGTRCGVVGLDLLWGSLHPEARPGWDAYRALSRATFHAAASLWASGYDTVVDVVFEREANLRDCREALGHTGLFLVGAACAPEVLDRREAARGDRRPGLARDQHVRVHAGCAYDLVVHGDAHDPETLATQVLAAWAPRA